MNISGVDDSVRSIIRAAQRGPVLVVRVVDEVDLTLRRLMIASNLELPALWNGVDNIWGVDRCVHKDLDVKSV